MIQHNAIREIYQLKRTTDVFTPTEAYVVNSDGRFCWLQRLALWVLRRWGQNFHLRAMKTELIRLDVDDVMERVFSVVGAAEDFTDRRPSRLFIGAEEWCTLLRRKELLHSVISFNADYRSGFSALGIEVVVVPWMDGMLAI